MKVRPALPEDAAAIARVHVDAWRETYAGLMPDEILAKLSYERREAMWSRVLAQPSETGVFVAEDEDGKVVAFVSGGAERSGDPEFQGELQGLYAVRRVHGQGIGRALVGAISKWLVARGFETLLLWVLDSNPTRGFYERLGGVACREKTATIGDVVLREIGYGWKDLGGLAKGGPCIDRLDLPLVGAEVWSCTVSRAAFSLMVTQDRRHMTTVTIESAFTLLDARGDEWRLTSADPDISRGVSLVGSLVSEAAVLPGGTLYLRFDNGHVVTVDPNWMYEAWQVEQDGGLHLVCMPGGKVATFGGPADGELGHVSRG